MRKDKSFVKARSRGVDLGSQHTETHREKGILKGERGRERERQREGEQIDNGEE